MFVFEKRRRKNGGTRRGKANEMRFFLSLFTAPSQPNREEVTKTRMDAMAAVAFFDVEETSPSFFEALGHVERQAARGNDDNENDAPSNVAVVTRGVEGVKATAGVSRSDIKEHAPRDTSATRKRRLPPSLVGASARDDDDDSGDLDGCQIPNSLVALEELTFDGQVVLAESPSAIDAAVARITRLCAVPGHSRVVGWDLEWVVTFKAGRGERPTSLVQLCCEGKRPAKPVCILLRLCRAGGMTPALRAFFEDPSIKKVGVQARGDAHKITRDFAFHVAGVIELKAHAAERTSSDAAKGPRAFSLAALVEWTLGRALPKTNSARISDWEAPVLSEEQQRYAALDAFAGLKVYQALEKMEPPTRTTVLDDASTVALATVEGLLGECSVDPNEITPALPQEKQDTLAPRQIEAHRMHLELGWSGERIAKERRVQPSTSNASIADAMRAGRAYRFGVLGVADRVLDAVRGALEIHKLTRAAVAAEGDDGNGDDANAVVGGGDGTTTRRALIRAVRDVIASTSKNADDVPSWCDVDFALAHVERLELLGSRD